MFSQIIEAYAQKKGIATSAFRFMFDGQRIQGDVTPKMLEMEDDDQIDAVLETVGGQ
jgi:small ubiquitin-related modifier